MSDQPIIAPNFILPPVFGGEVKESKNISAKEMEFRKRVKDYINQLAEEFEIDAPDIVVGLIPISFEVCLEQININYYEEAMESYHDLWHEFFAHIEKMKEDVAAGFQAMNPDVPFVKKGRMDWS